MSLSRILGFGLGSEVVAAFKLQQPVRWKRKPRWLPMAKSKMFRVAPRPVVDPIEVKELKRLHDNYHTQVRAVRNFFHQDFQGSKLSLDHIGSEKNILEEERQWAESIHANEMWNKEIAQEREIYLKNKFEVKLGKIERHKEYMKKKLENISLAAQQKINTIAEQSKTFIKREDLDEAILCCLDNPVNYNYALELDGNKISEFDDKDSEKK